MTDAKGQRTEAQIWTELVAIFEREQPECTLAVV
jgi:hypothetical protein